MPTVAQILTNRDDGRPPARYLTGTVTGISGTLAAVTVTGGASIKALVPLDVPAAAGSVVLVLVAPSACVILARLSQGA
jgi:hypothetical protein